eukprot:Clim_evm7s26 gene=Clim_evmTU7s26
MSGFDTDDEEDICRVCRSEATLDRPLFYPCKCTGSIKHIHQDCLLEWLKHSKKDHCELCGHKFQFRPVYSENAPESLPLGDFLHGLMIHMLLALQTWIRFCLVFLSWFFVMPFVTIFIWRLLLDGDSSTMNMGEMTVQEVGYYCFQGIVISCCIVFLFLALMALRDFLVGFEGQQNAANGGVAQQPQNAGPAAGGGPEAAVALPRQDTATPGGATEQAHATGGLQTFQEHSTATESTSQESHRNSDALDGIPSDGNRSGAPRPIPVARDRPYAFRSIRRSTTLPDESASESLDRSVPRDIFRETMSHMDRPLNVPHRASLTDLTSAAGGAPQRSESNSAHGRSNDDNFHNPPRDQQDDDDDGDWYVGSDDHAADARIDPPRRYEAAGPNVDNNHPRDNAEPWQAFDGENENEGDGDGGGGWAAIFDGPHDDLSFEELIGLAGPISNLGENIFCVLLFNFIFIFMFAALPHYTGKFALNILASEVMNDADASPNQAISLANNTDVNHVKEFMLSAAESLAKSANIDPVKASAAFYDKATNIAAGYLTVGIVSGLLVSMESFLPAALTERPPVQNAVEGQRGVRGRGVNRRGEPHQHQYQQGNMALNTMRLAYGFFKTYHSFFKVSILMITELVLFPFFCGWWLDICSLVLFGSTVRGRFAFTKTAFLTSCFLHWLAGMLYMFHFANFVSYIREVCRPGLLWFLRNPNDPNFHPIREMVDLPVHRHLRRLGLSAVMYGVIILILVWLPIKVSTFLFPNVLPFELRFSEPLTRIPIEFVVFHFLTPQLFRRVNFKKVTKTLIFAWSLVCGRILGLEDYLMGDMQNMNYNQDGERKPSRRAVDTYRDADDPIHSIYTDPNVDPYDTYEPYPRPRRMTLRQIVFALCLISTFTLINSSFIVIPTVLGRAFIKATITETPVHELYTYVTGLYLAAAIAWMVIRISRRIQDINDPEIQHEPEPIANDEQRPRNVQNVQQAINDMLDDMTVADPNALEQPDAPVPAPVQPQRQQQQQQQPDQHNGEPLPNMNDVLSVVAKTMRAVVAFALVGILLPFVMGIFIDVLIIIPLRIPVNETPAFLPWQDWALGVVYLKIIHQLILLGPQEGETRQVLERLAQDGIWNVNLTLLWTQIVWPFGRMIMLALTFPYILSHGVAPMILGDDPVALAYGRRYGHLMFIGIWHLQLLYQLFIAWLQKLHQRIRDDHYRIGERLENYDKDEGTAAASLEDEPVRAGN